jgi:hypothetical protein
MGFLLFTGSYAPEDIPANNSRVIGSINAANRECKFDPGHNFVFWMNGLMIVNSERTLKAGFTLLITFFFPHGF